MKVSILAPIAAITVVVLLVAGISTSTIPHNQIAYAQNNTSATKTNTTTTTNTTASTTDYRQYSNSTLGIKLEVPADWLYKEINNTAVSFVSAPNGTNRAAVVVDIETVPSGMSLDNFTQGNIQYLQQTTPGFNLITSNSTTLTGSPAHQVVFTAPSSTGGQGFGKGMGIWTLKNGKAYLITYRAEPGLGSFTAQFPIANHMIKSFQVVR
jgi:eukaryotic-like serine/threonine-protein kinase